MHITRKDQKRERKRKKNYYSSAVKKDRKIVTFSATSGTWTVVLGQKVELWQVN